MKRVGVALRHRHDVRGRNATANQLPSNRFLLLRSRDVVFCETTITFENTLRINSMSVAVTRMLFTDDGRPPRERLLIVPDVDTTVPRLVCSM